MPHYDEARGMLSDVVLQNATLVATATHAATSKATPVDADELPLVDSASSFSLKKLTWANLKATLATWLDAGLIPATLTTLKATLTFKVGAGAAAPSQKLLVNTPNGVEAGIQILQDGIESWTVSMPAGSGTLNVKYSGAQLVAFTPTGLAITGTITTSAAGAFHATSVALGNGAGAAAGTLLNAPAAGNPTKWIGINDNGTTRYIPAW